MSEFQQQFDADDIMGSLKSQFKSWGKASGTVTKPKKVPLKLFISFLITAVVTAVAYYIMLPPLNIHATETYTFLIMVIAVFIASFFVVSGAMGRKLYMEYSKKASKVPLIIIAVIVVVMVVGFIAGATVLRSRSYSQLMDVTSSDFQADFDEISFSDVPRLDASSTKTLADNKLNELSQYVSQFLVSDVSTQINYKEKPVRVAPLQYGDFFKWMNNTKNGLPAYMLVNMVSMEVSVVELEEGMRYSPSELFNRNLVRHLRFQFPTTMFDTPNFEIDDSGHPYWITASLTKKIGLFGGTDVKAAILTDAVTGESTMYNVEDVPNWVDRVYSDKIILEQYNFHGRFQNGFINSILGQKDVKVTSQGNGYIAMDDDVWLYTGVTSASSDASNVGFILCNQRTKETRYYEIGGAIETGAMASAQGAVQNYGYVASFPILLNVSGEPTYFMPLKDTANTVKQYAMVNFKQRTIYGIGNSPESCAENYTESLVSNNVVSQSDVGQHGDSNSEQAQQRPTVTGLIAEIRTTVKDGNTFYYFKVDDVFYTISSIKCEDAVVMSVGDTIKVEFQTSESRIKNATSIVFA